jgi:tripartite-type tricarboxylate transporter receptor subunit TctC
MIDWKRLTPRRNLLAAALFALTPLSAQTQSYPAKPIKSLVTAGGPAEVIARLIAQKMTESMGQPVIVEPGAAAGGAIAAAAVARAAPDGYTIMYGVPTPLVYRMFLARNVPYDPIRDFTPLANLGHAALVIAAPASSPFRNVNDAIAYAKANPGKLSYGTSGVGSAHHLSAELLSIVAGLKMVHIPYKDSAQVVTETIAERIPLLFTVYGAAAQAVSAGKLRFLGMNMVKRYPSAPDVPTVTEQVPGYEAPPGWSAYFGPAGMPEPLVQRLNTEVTRALLHPEVAPKMPGLGILIETSTPAELGALLKRSLDYAGKTVKAAGIEPE